jgi:hypothetical protein
MIKLLLLAIIVFGAACLAREAMRAARRMRRP